MIIIWKPAYVCVCVLLQMPMSPLQEALIEEALVEVAEQAERLANDIYFKTSKICLCVCFAVADADLSPPRGTSRGGRTSRKTAGVGKWSLFGNCSK